MKLAPPALSIFSLSRDLRCCTKSPPLPPPLPHSRSAAPLSAPPQGSPAAPPPPGGGGPRRGSCPPAREPVLIKTKNKKWLKNLHLINLNQRQNMF